MTSKINARRDSADRIAERLHAIKLVPHADGKNIDAGQIDSRPTPRRSPAAVSLGKGHSNPHALAIQAPQTVKENKPVNDIPHAEPTAEASPTGRKPPIDIATFMAVDMRAGTVVSAVRNPKARKPAYALSIDLGPLGTVKSSAQLVDNYTAEQLVGRKVVVVVNLPPRKVAGVKSEVLVLANLCPTRGTVLLGCDSDVVDGAPVA